MEPVYTYVGTLAKPASTGTQAISGLPFRPKAIVFSSVLRTAADGFESAEQKICRGFSDGTTSVAVAHSSDGTGVGAGAIRNDCAILVVDEAGTVNSKATVDSITSDGFVLDWVTSGGHTGALINYFAIGGAGVSAVAGAVAANAGTGNQSVTGLGIAPNAVLFLAAPFGVNIAGVGFGPYAAGWMTSTTQGVSGTDTANSADIRRYQRTDRCLATKGAGGTDYEAEAVSLGGDGFTVNWLTAKSGAYVLYLAIAGVSVTSGAVIAPSSTQTVTVSSGFTPKGVLMMSNGNVASTSVDTTANEMAFGACDDGDRQRVSWSSDRTSTGDTSRYESDSAAIVTAGSGSSLQSRGVVSFNAFSFDIAWTITSADSAQVLYLVIGQTTTPLTYEDPCDITEPRIYTTITTEDETLKFGVHPLRDSAALGGYADPRLIDVSAITKAASDPSTGAWSAQTASTRFADTDRENRERTETRFGFRGCTQEIYLTSTAQRLADGPPRVLFSGIVNADACDENLVWSTSINDLIGNDYSLFAEEKQIPQRVIAVTHFPNAPKDALGRGEPILGGRLAPANTANGEGVVDGIYCGEIEAGSSPGTPDAGDLAALVADMQAAADAGTLDHEFGDRLGHSDCQLYEFGTIPATEVGLKAVFGGADIDAILQEYAATGGSTKIAVVFAGHAVKEVLDAANSNPSIWINETQIDPLELGVSIDIETSYDIVGTDGVTRRYFLLLVDPGSDYGTQIAEGARVHLDCLGIESVGDGTGTALTDYFALYRHVLINFLLQNYLTGAWLSSPQFLFSDGVTLLDRVDEASFDTASTVAAAYLSGGYLGGFKIGDRTSIRTIIQNFNASVSCLLGQDDYGRLFVKLLNPSRSAFLTNRGTLHTGIRDKVDFLPGFRVEAKPDWQVNRLNYQYAQNYYLSQYERGDGGGGVTPVQDTASQATDGVITKTLQFPYVRDDATALAVAEYYVDMFGKLPRVVSYARRGLCGLTDDVLDGVSITHYNGYGSGGWVDHAVWVLSVTFDPKRMYRAFTALDVERLVS